MFINVMYIGIVTLIIISNCITLFCVSNKVVLNVINMCVFMTIPAIYFDPDCQHPEKFKFDTKCRSIKMQRILVTKQLAIKTVLLGFFKNISLPLCILTNMYKFLPRICMKLACLPNIEK